MSLKNRNLSNGTIFTHIKNLKAFYNFLVNEDYLDKNPMRGIKTPKRNNTYPFVLNKDEVSRLLKATKSKRLKEARRNYAIVIFLVDTGVRVSELTGLNVDDVSLTNYTARVKGKTGERVVHFGQATAKALSAYLKTRGYLPHEDAFFISVTRRTNRLTRNGVGQLIRKLGKKAGITNK